MMWEIENEDEVGEGIFFVDAPTLEKALEIYRAHETAQIQAVSTVEWCSLATVSGELGETYYRERQRKVVEKYKQ